MQEKETLDEKLPGLFEPDTLLPIQYFEAMRRKHLLEGEKRLVLSVLEDAVECFMKCIDSSTNKGQRLFRDAEEWINLEDKKWVFSFDNVCEMLDVNPEYLRRGLREWKVRKLDAIERARVARAEQAALAASQPVVEDVIAPQSVVKAEVEKPAVTGGHEAGHQREPFLASQRRAIRSAGRAAQGARLIRGRLFSIAAALALASDFFARAPEVRAPDIRTSNERQIGRAPVPVRWRCPSKSEPS